MKRIEKNGAYLIFWDYSHTDDSISKKIEIWDLLLNFDAFI